MPHNWHILFRKSPLPFRRLEKPFLSAQHLQLQIRLSVVFRIRVFAQRIMLNILTRVSRQPKRLIMRIGFPEHIIVVSTSRQTYVKSEFVARFILPGFFIFSSCHTHLTNNIAKRGNMPLRQLTVMRPSYVCISGRIPFVCPHYGLRPRYVAL